MEEKEPVTIEEIVNRLKSINKDELTERQFFQEVMSVINDMKENDLTEENFEIFSTTLKEIGCVDYNSWLSERRSHNINVKKQIISKEIDIGAISGAELMISKLLDDYNKAQGTLRIINDNSQGKSWVEKWLKNSQDPIKAAKRKSDSEYEYIEEGLLKQKSINREREQAEIPNMEVTKALLKAEMEHITQKLENIKNGEMKLNKDLEEKQEEFNNLEEK